MRFQSICIIWLDLKHGQVVVGDAIKTFFSYFDLLILLLLIAGIGPGRWCLLGDALKVFSFFFFGVFALWRIFCVAYPFCKSFQLKHKC